MSREAKAFAMALGMMMDNDARFIMGSTKEVVMTKHVYCKNCRYLKIHYPQSDPSFETCEAKPRIKVEAAHTVEDSIRGMVRCKERITELDLSPWERNKNFNCEAFRK